MISEFENIKEGDLVLSHKRVGKASLTTLNCWLPEKVTAVTKAQFKVGRSAYWKKNGDLVGGGKESRISSTPSQHVKPYTAEDDQSEKAELAIKAAKVRDLIDSATKAMRPAVISHSDYLKPNFLESAPLLDDIEAKAEELKQLIDNLNKF